MLGPAGVSSLSEEKIPRPIERIPKLLAKIAIRSGVFDSIRAVVAGIIRRELTNNTPTILIDRATIIATIKVKINDISGTFTPSTLAKSSFIVASKRGRHI